MLGELQLGSTGLNSFIPTSIWFKISFQRKRKKKFEKVRTRLNLGDIIVKENFQRLFT